MSIAAELPSTSSSTSGMISRSDSNNERMIEMLRETTIYLNNTAVTLLGTYNNHVAAIQTMKDALELLSKSINMTSTSTNSSSNNTRNNSSDNTTFAMASIYDLHQRVIRNASDRLQIETQIRRNDGRTDQILPAQHPQHGSHTALTTTSTATNHIDTTDETPKMNDIGVVVLSCHYNPNDAYHLLATIRTSKVAIRIAANADSNHNNNNNTSNDDYFMNLHVVRSILVYNYGIAHRCCTPAPPLTSTDHNNTATTTTITSSNNNNTHQNHGAVNNKVGTFCLQIFQYAEQLLIPALESNNNACLKSDEAVQPQAQQEPASALSSAPNNYLLLYRFILTRNLMMISCKMGMLLCELYKQTLDPIESEILLLPPQLNNNELNSQHRSTTTETNQDTGTWNNNNSNNNASAA